MENIRVSLRPSSQHPCIRASVIDQRYSSASIWPGSAMNFVFSYSVFLFRCDFHFVCFQLSGWSQSTTGLILSRMLRLNMSLAQRRMDGWNITINHPSSNMTCGTIHTTGNGKRSREGSASFCPALCISQTAFDVGKFDDFLEFSVCCYVYVLCFEFGSRCVWVFVVYRCIGVWCSVMLSPKHRL